jgi:ElaB/YqjD/DUF883 family membrane-anchored ribosome-binding protein
MDTSTREAVETGKDIAEEKMAGLKEKFEQGKEAAKKYASQAKDYAYQAKDKAGEYAEQAKDATETQIKENPFWSMLIAVGVGAAIGLTVGMAMRGSSED